MSTGRVCAGDAILHAMHDGVLRITFNRPERRHAINADMYRHLAWLFTWAREDDAVRVVQLAGAGSYFTAGNDLADFIGFGPEDEFPPAPFLRALVRCTKPIVAAVEGGAIGVGATMLLHCDFAYAGASTQFLMPFIGFGLCPEGASSLALPRSAGYKQAARWLMLGEQFGAEQAREAGLVTEVVADGGAMAHAERVVNKLLAAPPAALAYTRALLRAQDQTRIEHVIESECARFVELLASPAAQSALARFTSRRSPATAPKG
jgi:enoyl-CoA hydratase/carnithine racemase